MLPSENITGRISVYNLLFSAFNKTWQPLECQWVFCCESPPSISGLEILALSMKLKL